MRAIDSQATKVNEALALVETTLKDLKEADDKRDEELKSLKEDIENIKTLIPKVRWKGGGLHAKRTVLIEQTHNDRWSTRARKRKIKFSWTFKPRSNR